MTQHVPISKLKCFKILASFSYNEPSAGQKQNKVPAHSRLPRSQSLLICWLIHVVSFAVTDCHSITTRLDGYYQNNNLWLKPHQYCDTSANEDNSFRNHIR